MADSDREPLLSSAQVNADNDTRPLPGHYHSINADLPLPSSIEDQSNATVRRTTPQRPNEREIRVYGRRWFILIMFSLMAGTQGCVWNTFGPIAGQAEFAFGWNEGDIGFLTGWGPISFVMSIVPCIYAMEHKGLRVACVWSAFFVAAGALVRIFTVDPPAVTYLVHIGQMLNGFAGPVAMAAPPAISVTWFPPEQRTRATAIATIFGTMGTASSFLLGPSIVPDMPTNVTSVALGDSLSLGNREDSRKAIHRLLYIECGWACALFVAMLIYFPKKPPHPPSASAAVPRGQFIAGFIHVVKLRKFWVVCLAYGLSQGVLNCWSSVINIILQPHHISEMEAGWIGFCSTLCGCVLSIIFAAVADRLKRKMKTFVVSFYMIGAVAFLIFALAAQNIYLQLTRELCWSTIVIGTTMIYATTPLLFELVAEIVYPAGEGTACGVMTLFNNIFGVIALMLLYIPQGSVLMTWLNVGATAISIPLLMSMRVRFNRDVDHSKLI